MRLVNSSLLLNEHIYTLYSINFNNINKKIEICFNIFAILSFIWFLFFIKLPLIKENISNSFLYLEKEQNLSQEIFFNSNNELKNNNISLRQLTTFFQGKYNKEDFIRRIQIKNIIDKLINRKFTGKWFTKKEEKKRLMIGDSIEGLTKVKFSRATQMLSHEDALAIIINNFEDKYINHWIYHTSFILNKELLIKTDKEKVIIYLNGKWETKFEYGELFFTKISRRAPCYSNLTIIFPLKNITISANLSNGESFTETFDTIDNSNFSISFNSSCGFNMSMEIFQENQEISDEINYELNKYVIVLFIILILNMLSIYLMNNDLKQNTEIISCISLFSLIQNINWHVYCCMTHLTWSITNNKFFFNFNCG